MICNHNIDMKPLPLPSYEKVDNLFNYCEHSGKLTWKKSYGGKAKKGSEAGYIRSSEYRVVGIDGKHYPAHRLIWLLVTKQQPALDRDIDHKNGVKNDNRFQNLRLVTNSENTAHHPGRPEPKCYQVNKRNGITWYQAIITVKGKRYNHGIYKTAEEASRIGREARRVARGL
jgi:hypothetical protein